MMKRLLTVFSFMLLSLGVAQAQQLCSAAYSFSTNNCTVAFTDQSTGSGFGQLSWVWDFGDGNTSASQNPSHTYAASGTYQVTLFLTESLQGLAFCTDSMTLPVIVSCGGGGSCTASFTQVTNGCTVAFTNTSTGNYSNIVWSFGDGFTSLQNSPTHTYASSGTYTVTLSISDTSQNCNDISTQTITVNCGGGGTCDAYFTHSINGCTVSFMDSSAGSNLVHLWNFGDGGVSPLASPTHTYASAGTYTVILQIIDSVNLCIDTYQDVITVNCISTPCSANFVPSVSGCTVNFNNTSTGSYNSTIWNFGDGNFSQQASPSHTYAASGTYTVSLTIVDSVNQSCFDTYSTQVTVNCVSTPCSASFVPSVTGCTVNFNNTSVGSFNSTIWNFGDGNFSQQTSPTHVYAAAGTYTVSLTVVDSSNQTCFDTYSTQVTVNCTTANCMANYTYQANGCTVNFTNSSTGNYSTTAWSFGDGNTSSQASPTHTYASSGSYTVILTILDSLQGCFDTESKTVAVNCSQTNCDADFSWAPDTTNGCKVYFTDQSTGAPNSWNWSFGDGNTGTGANPNHTYASAGTYTVLLTINNQQQQCSDTISKVVTVNCSSGNNCSADFSMTIDTTTCQAVFTDLSTGNINGWAWTYGDGNGSSVQNPSHTYTTGGTYIVSLTVFEFGGGGVVCQDSISKSFTFNCWTTQSIANSLEDKVSIYPNPVEDQVWVELSPELKGETEIGLYNLMGQEVSQQTTTQSKLKISTDGLPAGIYFIKLRNKSGQLTHRLMKLN